MGAFVESLEHVPFGDVEALEEACKRRRPAAFFVEPIQGEGGIRVPPDSYLRQASLVCHKHGCLLVVDEIQTGLGRTGRMFATEYGQVLPDVLLLGKALSGGCVPIATAMMTDDVWKRAFAGPERCHLNASTFAGGLLAVTAALETLAVLEDEVLAARASNVGAILMKGLQELAARHEALSEARGRGLLMGIEFKPPSGLAGLGVPRWAREGLHAQVIATLLLRDHGILTQTCGLAQRVLRVEPPLVVSEAEIGRFLDALDRALAACPSYSSAAIGAFRKRVLRKDL